MGIEDPDSDVAEQQRPLIGFEEDDVELPDGAQPPLEADPADFADQHRAIPLTDEDR